MSDLLTQDIIDQFRASVRDVTDTFHKSPVILLRSTGEEVDLLAGMKADDVGSYGEVDGEIYAQEDHREKVERWIVAFNRDYLAEKGLIDPDEEENKQLLITTEDRLVIAGKRFSIVKINAKGVFRGLALLVQLTVQR